MLALTEKQKLTFANEYSEKFFILFAKIGNIQRNYSHDNISIYDNDKNSWYNFIGSFVNEVSFDISFKPENNAYNLPSISVSIIDEGINLVELGKTLAINFSEIKLHFITDQLSIDEALPLFQGIIGIDTIDTPDNPFSISFINTDNKYDKQFPPRILGVNVPDYTPTFDAEKYNGESIPIAFGYIDYPGLPIPILTDNNVSDVIYAVCSHNITDSTGFAVYADGILINSANYTRAYASGLNQNYYYLRITRANYNTYFKGKKITCTFRGLLYTTANPLLGDVLLYLLQNYSNLYSDLIDLQGIGSATAYLGGYQVARFFNSSSTIFTTIKELSLEFPFIFNESGFKKTITCVDPNFIPYSFELLQYKYWLERLPGIKISKINDTYNKFIGKYKYDALSNRWRAIYTIDQSNNSYCKTLYTQINNTDKQKEELELYSVADQSTVINVLNWQVNVHTLIKFTITYKCKHNCIILEIGDGLYVTDEEINIIRKKFMVIGKVIKRDFIYLTVQNVEPLA